MTLAGNGAMNQSPNFALRGLVAAACVAALADATGIAKVVPEGGARRQPNFFPAAAWIAARMRG